jgi:hypothetical protein
MTCIDPPTGFDSPAVIDGLQTVANILGMRSESEIRSILVGIVCGF